MSFFIKKNFLYKLIVCICIVLTLINTTGIKNVYASGIGGVLINPICNLLGAIGDGIMNIVQRSIMGQPAILEVDNSDPSWWETVKGWFVAIVVIVVAVVACIFVPGLWPAVVAKVTSLLASLMVTYGAFSLVFGIDNTNNMVASVCGVVGSALGDTFAFPSFMIGPEEIFSGKILLFDANIFNPKELCVEYIPSVDFFGDRWG